MNIILIEKNKIRLKEINNKISQSNINAKIFSIFFDIVEAIPLINMDNIDIIIYSEIHQKISCEQLLNIMKQSNKSISEKKFIFITNSENNFLNLMNKPFVKTFLESLENNDEQIAEKIFAEISKIDEDLIVVNKIKSELKKLNFNFSYWGTYYLINTIYEIYKFKGNMNINLSKNIFTIVGKKFNKNANTIHSGIKKAIINMYYDCNESTLIEYFNCACFDNRPKLKQLIFQIISKIQ